MTECQNCEYHKNRAARWRAEAYKQAGHDVIELPWVGLTDEEIWKFWWSRPEVAEGEDDSMEAEFVAAVRRVLAAHGIKE